MTWNVRLATDADIPALEKLIPESMRALSTAHYSQTQIEGAIDFVIGVDRQLIRDETYYVVHVDGCIIGCGGWSKRQTLFGSDHHTSRDNRELDPATQPARIRAFFVRPDFARRGIARAIIDECERAIRAAGFKRIELRATLPGVPFYIASGYTRHEDFEAKLPNDTALPVVRMAKDLD